MSRRFSNVVGFDDAAFPRDHRGTVPVVGAVYANLRLDGVLMTEIQKDGNDAAEKLARLVGDSKFAEHIQLVLLQGITLAGFNVVDLFSLSDRLARPVLAVARKAPDLAAIRAALLSKIQDGEKKWQLIQRLGPMEAVGEVLVQRVGLSLED
ncbi:MAG: DUF99 family protein, partial [Calditrichaeota bacterium]